VGVKMTTSSLININDKIEEWHNTEGYQTLHAFLEMTWSEFSDWVEGKGLPEHLKKVYTDEEKIDEEKIKCYTMEKEM
jgi:hypothetical protein